MKEVNYVRLTKADLAKIEDVRSGTLKRWMNGRYFEELSSVGYNKNDVSLSPAVVRKWFEMRGHPMTQEELNDYISFSKDKNKNVNQ